MISWQDFEKVDLRVGTILKAEDFPQTHKPEFFLFSGCIAKWTFASFFAQNKTKNKFA